MLGLKQIKKIAVKQQNKPVLITDDFSFGWTDYKVLVESNLVNLLKNEYLNTDTTRVIIMSENSWKLFILYSCLVTSKVAYSGIDYTMNDEKKIACIKQSGANTVFYSEDNKPSDVMLASLPNIKFINLDIIKEDTIDDDTDVFGLVKQLNHSDDVLSFSFTSGTTGLPKCIYRKSSFDKRRLGIFTNKYEITSDDIYLVTMPFYHVSVNGWAKLTLVNGGTVVFGDFSNADDLYYKITNYNVTSMLITPPVLQRLVPVLQKNNYQNTSVHFIMVGGKNFPTILKEQAIELFGPVINEYYGSSETGINTLADSQDMSKYPAASGQFMEGSKLIILDDKGNVLPSNSIGRIAIQSFQCADGYMGKKMAEITFDGERYVITSDYGYLNAEGYIFVTQRVLFDDNDIENNLFSLENRIRMIRNVEDLVIIQDENNYYTINVKISKESTSMMVKIIVDAINGVLASSQDSFNLNIVNNINYSLSGKVKYNEFLNSK
ncbi:AMP-binding protein [Lactiplantibacillus pentosus]